MTREEPLDLTRCSHKVRDPISRNFNQCSRKVFRDGLCKQHAPKTEAELNANLAWFASTAFVSPDAKEESIIVESVPIAWENERRVRLVRSPKGIYTATFSPRAIARTRDEAIKKFIALMDAEVESAMRSQERARKFGLQARAGKIIDYKRRED